MSEPSPDAVRRPGSLRVGRLAGVPVFVSYSWIIVAVFLAVMFAANIDALVPGLGNQRWLGAVTFVLLFYGSVFLHEAAHTLLAKGLGVHVSGIVLHFFGGYSEMSDHERSPWRSMAIAVAGPIASLAVALGCWLLPDLTSASRLAQVIVLQLAISNLFVGLFNLLPGLPLDGGHIVEALIWGITGKRHVGTRVAGWAGRVVAVSVVVIPLLYAWFKGSPSDLFLVMWGFLLATTMWGGASVALQAAELRKALPGLHARTLARSAIGVPADAPVSEVVNRAQQHRVHAVVTLDPDGRPVGIINEVALEAVPAERRPWVSASSVSRTITDGMMVPDDLTGEDLLKHLSQTATGEYLVMDRASGVVIGVLSARDVNSMLTGR
jgi:Zn-dependent protease